MKERFLWPTLLFVLLIVTGCSRTAPGATVVERATETPIGGEANLEDAGSDSYRPAEYRLRAGELVLAANEDDIPAIMADDTLFVDAESGSREWQDDDLVIGLALEDDARAYPVRLLSSHEIVNDVVGGRPVAVTWCPLCYSALVFDRVVERELTFGVSGYLFRNNLVMYDHQTNTLWSQILAQGIRGALKGETLELVPSQLMEWGQWKAQYPHTRVLSAERMGQEAGNVEDPYAGYYASDLAGITGSGGDDRLRAKELVVGLVVDNQARAYPLSALKERTPINDALASVPVLLLYDREAEAVRVYSRRVDGQVLTFVAGEGAVRDESSGSRWDASSGVALEGPLRGARLQRLSAPLVYWFAWSAIYPQTELGVPLP
ncbi:MAG: DUF3179 domain-containing protein [bacterium]